MSDKTVRYNKDSLELNLECVLGVDVVYQSGMTNPRLVDLAAKQLFKNGDMDSDTANVIRQALVDLDSQGYFNYTD